MAIRYKLYADLDGQPVKAIQRILDDGAVSSIPMIPDNTDYADYLEWAKTNTIEAAD